MTTTMPSRAAIDRAAPLDFDRTPQRLAPAAEKAPQVAEKQANITIEVAPDGLHIKAEYTGTLASIPAALERLRASGVLDLVQASAPSVAPAAAAAPTRAPSDAPKICPVHHEPMKPMTKPDKKGYTHWCTKKSGEDFCKERA